MSNLRMPLFTNVVEKGINHHFQNNKGLRVRIIIAFCLYLYYLEDRCRGLVILVFMTTYGNSSYHHERFESQYHS
jgi:hypothetical protein